ncbi:small membrane protein YoaI [Enterobacter wuhouensis]
MNDHMFVETLIISTTFLTIAIILVASVLLLERNG